MLHTGASGEGSAGKPEALLSLEQGSKGDPPALLRPQDISAELAAAAATPCTLSAASLPSKEATSSDNCKVECGKGSCGEVGLISEVSNPASTDRVGSASGGSGSNGIIENQAPSSNWALMPTVAMYTRNGLASDSSTDCGIAATGAIPAHGKDQRSSRTGQQQPQHVATCLLAAENTSDVVHRSKRSSVGDISIGAGVDILTKCAGLQPSEITPWLNGLSLEVSKNPVLGYRNHQNQRQLPQQQQQQQQPSDPELTTPSTGVLTPHHLAVVSGEMVAAAAGGRDVELFSNGDLDPRSNLNVPTAGLPPREPLRLPKPSPLPTQQTPGMDLAAARAGGRLAVASPEPLAPPSQRPTSTMKAAPSCVQPPPPLESQPRQILPSTSLKRAPAGPKGGKRSGGGRGNGGSGRGRGGKKVGGGGSSGGDGEGKSTRGGAGTVRSMSPKPTKASKKTRERTQSLGRKPKQEMGNKGARGKGKRQGKEGGARGRSGKGDRVVGELGKEAGGGDSGGSGELQEGLELEENEEALTSPTGRKIYKGSEHGKVKILFPKMSPWRRNRLRFDEESLWSITDQNTADEISSIALMLPGVSTSTVVMDGTACVGGNAISFASIFDEVWAVEIDEERFALLKGNVKKAAGSTPGCSRRVRFFNADFLSVLETEKGGIGDKRPVIFLDPPWGGVHYKKHDLVDLLLSDTPVAEVCERAAEAGARHVLLKVPTNFNIKGFRHAVGSSGRVTVHDRNMRKMLLVAVDYDLEPLVSSPPPSPYSSTVSPADELGDYSRFDVAAAAASLDNTVVSPGGVDVDRESRGTNGAVPWLDSLLLKASRSPTFEQQQQQLHLRGRSTHELEQKEEDEDRVPPNGIDISRQARAAAAASVAAELLGMLHAKLPVVQPPQAGREAGADVSSHGDMGGGDAVIEAPNSNPNVMARLRLKELLGLDTSGDGEMCGQNASNAAAADSAPKQPDPYVGSHSISCDSGGRGGVVMHSSEAVEGGVIEAFGEGGQGVVAETVSSECQEVSTKEGVAEGGGKDSATEGTRRRLKEILGVKL